VVFTRLWFAGMMVPAKHAPRVDSDMGIFGYMERLKAERAPQLIGHTFGQIFLGRTSNFIHVSRSNSKPEARGAAQSKT
jgi:hypothetical protein